MKKIGFFPKVSLKEGFKITYKLNDLLSFKILLFNKKLTNFR